jgi:hypothetical protein
VEHDACRVDTGRERRVELPTGRDVDEQPLGGDDLEDRGRRPRLRRVDDAVRAERRDVARQRARSSSPSTTYSGVPCSSASTSTPMPPTVTTPRSSRATERDQGVPSGAALTSGPGR